MRVVSFDRHRRPIVRIGENWYGEDHMTKTELIEAEKMLLAHETPLPLFDGTDFYWPDCPNHKFNEDDTVADLVQVFAFTPDEARMVCESSRLMYRVQKWIDEN
jgi:hypothetical protein